MRNFLFGAANGIVLGVAVGIAYRFGQAGVDWFALIILVVVAAALLTILHFWEASSMVDSKDSESWQAAAWDAGWNERDSHPEPDRDE